MYIPGMVLVCSILGKIKELHKSFSVGFSSVTTLLEKNCASAIKRRRQLLLGVWQQGRRRDRRGGGVRQLEGEVGLWPA